MSMNRLVSFFLNTDPILAAAILALAICLLITGAFNIWVGIITAVILFVVFTLLAIFILARFTPEDITQNYDPLS